MIMRRKVFFLAGVVGFILLLVGLVKLAIGSQPKQGVLKVDSMPSASIFLDNKHKGRTPFEDKVEAGEHTIKIVPDSGTSTSLASWQGKITVSSGALTYINRDLSESELSSAGEVLWLEKITSNKSELSVTTIPDGATLLVDDENKGITPVAVTSIASADHTISVTSPGFVPRTFKAKTPTGYKLNALIQLALSTRTASEPQASASGSPTPTPAVAGATTSAPTPVATPTKPYITIKDTPTGFLRVRTGPAATDSGKVVKPGETYSILDSQTVSETIWYYILYDGTNKGWVSGQYAEKVE